MASCKSSPFTVMLVLCAVHVVATFTTFLSKFVSSFPLFLLARFLVGGKDYLINFYCFIDFIFIRFNINSTWLIIRSEKNFY